MDRHAASLTAIVGIVVALSGPPARAQDDCIAIDDFATATVGEFPSNWKVR